MPFASHRLATTRLGAAALQTALVLLLSLAQVQGADDPLDDFRLAAGYFNKEHWKLAAESFQEFVKKNPRHPRAENARYLLGVSLAKLEDFSVARDVLRNFLKDFPKSQDARSAGYWVGHCSFHLDDLPAAEKELSAFLAAAAEDPLREWALPYLGDVELRLKKPEAALRHFQEAVRDHPRGALVDDARWGLARSYDALKKYPEAVALYKEISVDRSSPRAANALLNLGGRHFDDGDYAAAAGDYDAIEKRFPESPLVPLAQLNQGFARYQLGEFRQAIVQFEKAAETEQQAAEALLWKGLSLKGLSDLPAAADVLKGAYTKHRNHPAADKLLHQWADCEQRRGDYEKARELFLEVVARWPQGALADESLHAACVAALNSGHLADAEKLAGRFDKEYPGNRLRFRQEVVKARLLAARKDFDGAVRLLQSVVDGSDIDSTKWQARYYLGDVYQRRNEHPQVLESTAPLARQLDESGGPLEYASVYVLRGLSQVALARGAALQSAVPEQIKERDEYASAAVKSAQAYLRVAPGGPLSPQAWTVRIVGSALLGDKPTALADLDAFRKAHASSPELDQAIFELGTIAYSREDWELAETMFAELALRPKDSRWHSRALADLGWTQMKRKRFEEAAAAFGRLLAEHPDDELVSEAAFMRASALQDSGKLPEAQAAFAEAFRRNNPSEHVFLAGLQSARLLVKLQKLSEADAAYDELLKRFPKRMEADRILDEWATAHYNAESYERADALFRRLAETYPESPLADNARLSLAESDLVNGRLDKARAEFTALAQDAKSDDGVRQRSWYQLMQVELESKRWDELRKVCAQLLEQFPQGTNRFEAEFRWAEADFQLAAYKDALDRLLKLKTLKTNPDVRSASWFPQVWVVLAESLFRLKQYDDLEKTVAEFREWDPKSPFLYQADEVLGRGLKNQAKFPEAREVFDRVVRDDAGRRTETAAKAQFHIAETYHHEKKYAEAVAEYLKVDILYKFPEWQALALYHAGLCHESLSHWKQATKVYEDLLRDYHKDPRAPMARERLEVVRKKPAE
jgi:cellulose synthase operon protein C